MPSSDDIEACLLSAGGTFRRVADGEWGLTLDVEDWPLDIGIALGRGAPALLRIQAPVCEPGLLDPHDLLHRNRLTPLVRFTHTSAGEVWIQADLPVSATRDELDTALALLVGAVGRARYAASAARRARSR